ncbi:hypothetical protein D3C73_1195140 [compost metagenome]
MNVDDYELRPLLPGLFNQGDLVHIRADDIAAPHNNQLCLQRFFRAGTAAKAHRVFPAGTPRSRADRPLQFGCAQPVEESPVHSLDAKNPHISVKVVRQDRFGTMLSGQFLKSPCDFSYGFTPGNPFEFPLSLSADALHRVQHPFRMIDPLSHITHLIADRSLRNRMVGISRHLHDLSVLFMQQ